VKDSWGLEAVDGFVGKRGRAWTNMKIMRAYKTELDPNNVQKTLFAKAAGVRRFVYNWGLSRRIEEYKNTGKSSNAIVQHKQLNALKPTEFPWMYDVSKCAPQEALRDLDEAYAGFFRRVKAGEKPGFPRFKSKHKDKPRFRFSSHCAVEKNKIKLPKIGWVRLKEDGYVPIEARQLSVTVKGTGSGRWFVSVQCEVEVPDAAKVEPARTVGIDVGLKSFAVTSDGEVLEHPKLLRKAEKRLKRLQRRSSRRQNGSSNRKKANKQLAAQHFKVACKRKDFIHKLTTSLVKTKPDAVFVVEDLSVANMLKNHKLAKAISDSGWSEFKRQLQYKTIWKYGEARVVSADRFFPSSKTCSECGYIKEDLKLKDRVFRCGSCGFELDRDLNAARNLSKYELPPVRRKVTPVESAACKVPRRSRNQTCLAYAG
jgi:putative transposase